MSCELRGGLDWIVLNALEKDRTGRYETANCLAADLKRHLNKEPVVAMLVAGLIIVSSPGNEGSGVGLGPGCGSEEERRGERGERGDASDCAPTHSCGEEGASWVGPGGLGMY